MDLEPSSPHTRPSPCPAPNLRTSSRTRSPHPSALSPRPAHQHPCPAPLLCILTRARLAAYTPNLRLPYTAPYPPITELAIITPSNACNLPCTQPTPPPFSCTRRAYNSLRPPLCAAPLLQPDPAPHVAAN
ncbi:hypothetical protein SLEP1_g29619 [Rubroshorea leprosula]|uniref:Uncharacterized protein n=1 Tax=Rubroshorea leprosula TaxID=152421 RepID=A0AAV5K388_9ROSI|nr:hypothetical protein SLEP1_g29619 [Rubroshorea leprosula]